MKQTLKIKGKPFELDSERTYFFTESPDDDEKLLRSALGLPITKEIVYYKDKTKIDSAVGVVSVRPAEMYDITDRWYTLEITLNDGAILFIHSAYLVEMQKSDFVDSANGEADQKAPAARPKKIGHVTAEILQIEDIPRYYKNRFVAFDVETTGFHPEKDRIVELGAVIFEDGKIVDSFSSLVNPKKRISQAATDVNHITQEMIDSAPSENKTYKSLISFLGNAVKRETVICAHNAQFDMSFFSNTLKRLGFDADLLFVDTLVLSRQAFPNMADHKLQTVAANFGLVNQDEHRASSDAEICGMIFLKLLPSVLKEGSVVTV